MYFSFNITSKFFLQTVFLFCFWFTSFFRSRRVPNHGIFINWWLRNLEIINIWIRILRCLKIWCVYWRILVVHLWLNLILLIIIHSIISKSVLKIRLIIRVRNFRISWWFFLFHYGCLSISVSLLRRDISLLFECKRFLVKRKFFLFRLGIHWK